MQPIYKSGHKDLILVGEDELEVRKYLDVALRCHGYDVEFAEDGYEVVRFLRETQRPVAGVLLDLIMPRKDGIQALKEIRQFNREIPVIVLSSAVSPVHVVEAMKIGATDYLAKPISHEELCGTLQRILAAGSRKTSASGAEANGPETDPATFVGGGRGAEFSALLHKIAPSEVPILIQGETGTGKEVLARYLHANSRRANKPFLKVNCAALPSELIESELFGYERGAFTGAFQKKAGRFELADGGTLLLDEIGDMDVKLQAKLLQVLQDQSFEHLGGKETVRVDVRILAATHRNLEQAIVAGSFRQDLYYRLNVISLEIPPLRERKGEIINIANLLLRKHSAPAEPVPCIPDDLERAMVDHDWSGNVRELENFVRKYLVIRDPEIAARDLRAKAMTRRSAPTIMMLPQRGAPAPAPEPATLERVSRAKERAETDTILSALNATRWNRKEAALMLGIEYKALLYKIKKLSIERAASSVALRNGDNGRNDDPHHLSSDGSKADTGFPDGYRPFAVSGVL